MSEIHEGVGSVIYPGIKQIVSASYTRSHGISPDVCQIEMAPQSLDPADADYVPIEPEGYLIIQFSAESAEVNSLGNRSTSLTQIVLQGCRADKASVSQTDSRKLWTIPIFDRRWKWKYGSLSGHWNVRKNGVLEKRKEKTARELADICLEAMGEVDYDTTALDRLEEGTKLPYRKRVRPEVHWDRIPPAQALDDLVTDLGFRVCLGWDDVVRICKYGEGALLSTDDLMSGGFEEELPEHPDSFTVVGEITMHEAMWELEAVGLDIDGEWKPIDHLSYKPSGPYGWNDTRPPNFFGIEKSLKEIEKGTVLKPEEIKRRKEQLKLARETVFRCYRLKYPVGTQEKESLRKKYDDLGAKVAEKVAAGARRGDDRALDRLLEKYEEAGRELFAKSKPVLPGPKQIDPRTGREGDYVLEEFEQVLPMFETRAELAIDPYTGDLTRKPAEVRGTFYSSRKEYNTFPNELIQRDLYEVMPEVGIIKFKDPVHRMGVIKVRTEDGGAKVERFKPFAAELTLLIAVPLKEAVTGQPARFEYVYEIPEEYRTKPAKLPSGLKGSPKRIKTRAGTKVVTNREIQLAFQATYEYKKNLRTGQLEVVLDEVNENVVEEDLEKLALVSVDVEMLNLVTSGGGSGKYAGLKKVDVDGAIQQVAIAWNGSGMVTTISRNREVDVTVPSFDQRQRNLALKQMIKSHNETVDKTEKVQPKG